MKGTTIVPFFIFLMNNDQLIQRISAKTGELLADAPGDFLVEVKIFPTNNVKIFIDGDQGVTIDRCVRINRLLSKDFEETQLFPADDYSLEVSSPGLDEPLKLIRQYNKNIGRKVEVELIDGRLVEGKLTGVTEESIDLEEIKGKKKEVIKHNFLLQNIKTTKIQVVF
ncbi:MAG: ribosome maturation factor [Chitinophagaceae bacterium]